MKRWLLYAMLYLGMLWASSVLALQPQDAVRSTGPLNVRSMYSLSSPIVGEVPTGTVGKVILGPFAADGYTWWLLSWENGLNGYSADTNFAYLAPAGVVFGDTLGWGWYQQARPNTTSDFKSTTKRVGSYSIKTITTAVGGQLYLKTNGFSTSGGHKSLRFSVRTQSANGQSLYVAMSGTNGTPLKYLNVWDYVTQGILQPGVWYDVLIPLSSLSAANKTVGGVVFETGVGQTFYVDDLAVTNESGSTLWTPPPEITLPTINLYEGNYVDEGNHSTSYVELTHAADYPITFTVSTYNSTYQEANYRGTGGDYLGLVDKVYTIPAGQTRVNIPVLTYQNTDPTDWEYEAFELRIDSVGSGVILGTDRTPISIRDVAITPPPPPPVTETQAGGIIYEETTGWGWTNGGWNGTQVDLAYPSAYVGSKAIKLVTTIAWGRLQLKSGAGFVFDTTGYNTLSFAYNLGTNEGELPYVGLIGANGTVLQYVALTGTATNTWYAVTLPLSELLAANKKVYGFEVQNSNPGTILVDSVKVGNDSVAPPPVQETQAGSVVYGEEAGWGWEGLPSSGAFINLDSPLAYSGNKGIQLRTMADGGRLQLTAKTGFVFNTAGFDSLSFAYNLGTNEGELPYVGLINASGNVTSYVPVTGSTYVKHNYGTYNLPENEWVCVSVSLSAFDALNTKVYGVVFKNTHPGTIHLDYVRFETNGGCN